MLPLNLFKESPKRNPYYMNQNAFEYEGFFDLTPDLLCIAVTMVISKKSQ